MKDINISNLLMRMLNEDLVIIVADAKARILYANENFTKLSGYSQAEAIGMPMSKLNSNFHSKEFFRQLWATVQGGQIWRGEIRNKSKEGQLYWVDTMIYPQVGQDGKVEGFLTIRRDVTREKLSQDDDQLDLNDFIFHMPAAVFRVVQVLELSKKENYFKFVSPEIEKVTGYEASEFQGKVLGNLLRFIKCGSRSDVESLFQRLNHGASEIETCEFFILDRSGEERRLRIHARAHQGEHLNLIDGILLDVTKEWKISESLKAEKLKLAQASRLSLIGELSAGIAHEINNPLAIISGKVEWVVNALKHEKVENKKVKEDLLRVLAATKRVAAIVGNIRTLSRNENAEETRVLSLKSVLSDALGYVKTRAVNHQVELEIDDFTDVQFQGRLVQASQVFINLTINAIDAVSVLKEKWIHIKVRNIDEFVEVRFIDSGSGIPEHLLEKIMDPFFTTKDIGKGTGLGLSISKNIVEGFGGRLFYELYDSHTSFVVHLPAKIGAVLLPLNVEDAIAAHVGWKQKILNYIKNADRSLVPSEISSDQRCSLGKWIVGHEEKYSQNPEFIKLKEVHRGFHLIAGEIVAKLNQGEKISFDVILSPQSIFFQKSNQIVQALLRLRDSVESIGAIAS